MFSSRVRGGKAYPSKKKIREFKTILFISKRVYRATTNKRFDSKKLIRLAVENMNSVEKCGHTTNAIQEKCLKVKDSGRSTIFIVLQR